MKKTLPYDKPLFTPVKKLIMLILGLLMLPFC